MGNSFRQQPGPTLYPESKTAVSEDILEVGLIVAFAMIAFSFVLIIPGIRGWEVRFSLTLFRVCVRRIYLSLCSACGRRCGCL